MAKVDFQSEIEQALHDDGYLEKLIKNISPERTKFADREKGEKVLLSVSEKHPERLYDKWDIFIEYLRSSNAFSKYPSLYIIAHLVKVDSENKFKDCIDEYLDIINDKSVMVASHLVLNCGKIAKIKPEFEPKITRKLLKIDSTNHSAEHKELIKSYIIEAFYNYLTQSTLNDEIIEFIKNQVNSSSNKTRKIAHRILKEYNL